MKRKNIFVIIGIFILTVSAVLFVIYRIIFSGPLSTKSDDWSNFVTYFSGFLSPIISVIGFYLVIVTIESTDKTNKTNNFVKALDNIENQIDKILQKTVYIKRTNTILTETILSSLKYTKKTQIEISDTEDMENLNNQIEEVYNLRQFLIVLSKLISRAIDVDNQNHDWTVIYKYKYSSICTYLLDAETFYFAELLKKLENRNKTAFGLTENDLVLLEFYKATSKDIHKDEF